MRSPSMLGQRRRAKCKTCWKKTHKRNEQRGTVRKQSKHSEHHKSKTNETWLKRNKHICIDVYESHSGTGAKQSKALDLHNVCRSAPNTETNIYAKHQLSSTPSLKRKIYTFYDIYEFNNPYSPFAALLRSTGSFTENPRIHKCTPFSADRTNHFIVSARIPTP